MPKILEEYQVASSPGLWYTINLSFSENPDQSKVNCAVTITMVNHQNYYYLMSPYGWNLDLTVGGTPVTILCKGANTNWSYPQSGIDYNWNNFYFYGDAKREHVVSKTFTCDRSVTGKLSWAIAWSAVSGLTVPQCGRLNVNGIVDSGFPAYKKATVGLTAAYPSVTSPNTNSNKAKHTEIIAVAYSSNTNSTANDVTKIQYSKDKKTWHTPTMYSNKACTTETTNGNSAGYFKMRPSANYGGKTIGEGENFTLYVRRHHVGGEKYYSSVVSKSFSTYATPSKPSITANKTISDVDDPIVISFGVDSKYNVGTDIVQYRINGSTWKTGKTTSGSGSFTFKPSDFGVGNGATYKVEVRRYLSEAGYYSPVSSLSLKTYSVPTITGVSLSKSVANANTKVTMNWNAWHGSHNESSTVKVEFVKTNSSTASAEKVILSTSLNATSGSFIPQNYISTAYDNKTVYLRFTRIHSVTKKSSKPVIVSFKALYRPLKAVVCRGKVGSHISLPNNETVSWSYPVGQYGIVTGYQLKLYTGSTIITQFTTTRTSWSVTNTLLQSLKAGVWYNLDIIPYYDKPTTFPGPTLTIKKFIQRVTGLGTPTILYPLDGGTFDANKKLRIVIELPEDQNATGNYSYAGLTLKISQYYSGAWHESTITHSSGNTNFSSNTLNMYHQKMAYKTSIQSGTTRIKISATVSNSNDTRTSDVTTISVINKINSLTSTTTQNNKILSAPYAEMEDFVNSIYSAYNNSGYAYEQSNTFSGIISVSDLAELYDKVKEISETTSDCKYTTGRTSVGFGTVPDYERSGVIQASNTYLATVISTMKSILG